MTSRKTPLSGIPSKAKNWWRMNSSLTKRAAALFACCIICTAINGQGEAYVALYPSDCRKARDFYAEHKSLFEAAAQAAGFTAQFLFGIVAPELTQYSYLQNRLETYSLRVFYVQNGKSYSDFSIGCFQMKPSFIEQLEEYVSSDSLLRVKYSQYLFASPETRAARVERINRLNTAEWQIKYLAVFCEMVRKRFGNPVFATEEDKLRFYASAYNCGFLKPEQHIREMMQKAMFPHFSKQKFRYADISLHLYQLTVNNQRKCEHQ
jgi:hypothetical protein